MPVIGPGRRVKPEKRPASLSRKIIALMRPPKGARLPKPRNAEGSYINHKKLKT
jgi:hypothetical protein